MVAYRMGENICKLSDKGLIFRLYEELLYNSAKNNPVKNSKGLEYTFFQRRYSTGQ